MAGVQYAALWLTACIHLHAFVMDHEDRQFRTKDRFYTDGCKLMEKEWHEQDTREALRAEEGVVEGNGGDDDDEEINLLPGRVKYEDLKRELFKYLNEQ